MGCFDFHKNSSKSRLTDRSIHSLISPSVMPPPKEHVTISASEFKRLVIHAAALSPECVRVAAQMPFSSHASIIRFLFVVKRVRMDAVNMPMDRWIKFLCYMPECNPMDPGLEDSVKVLTSQYLTLVGYAVYGTAPISEADALTWASDESYNLLEHPDIVIGALTLIHASETHLRRKEFFSIYATLCVKMNSLQYPSTMRIWTIIDGNDWDSPWREVRHVKQSQDHAIS